MTLNPASKARLREALLLCSWIYWIAGPICLLVFPNPFEIQERSVWQDAIFTIAATSLYLGSTAWVVTVIHAVRTKLCRKPIKVGWLIALWLLGPFASPFYVIKEMPKHLVTKEDATTS